MKQTFESKLKLNIQQITPVISLQKKKRRWKDIVTEKIINKKRQENLLQSIQKKEQTDLQFTIILTMFSNVLAEIFPANFGNKIQDIDNIYFNDTLQN